MSTEPKDNLPAKNQPQVAFVYGGVEVTYNDDRLINLTEMYKAATRPANQDPAQWVRGAGAGFIADLAKSLNMGKSHVIKALRGKGVAGTWAHKQIALAYAKYLSHEFHRFVNDAFLEWVEEKADPALKAERAIVAFEKAGRPRDWIEHRFKGIDTRNSLTSTMKEHDCKVQGKVNPYAKITQEITRNVLGQTPKEIREEKNLPASAKTRDFLPVEDLISIECAEAHTRRLIQEKGAKGNSQCVEIGRRVSEAIGDAIRSLSKLAIVGIGFLGCGGCCFEVRPYEPPPPIYIKGCGEYPLTPQQSAALSAQPPAPGHAVITSQPSELPPLTPGVPLEHDRRDSPPPSPAPRLEPPEALPSAEPGPSVGPQAALRPVQWSATTWIPVRRVDQTPRMAQRQRPGDAGALTAVAVIRVRDKPMTTTAATNVQP